MPMHYPPLSNGAFRYGDPAQPLPSPVPGPEPAAPPGPFPQGPSPQGPFTHGPPGPGPAPGTEPDRQRRSGAGAALAIGGVLGAVVVVALGLALFGPDADRGTPDRSGPSFPTAFPAPERDRAAGEFPVAGTFEVTSTTDEPVSGDATGCDLPMTLTDIGEGTRITLLDPSRAPLATALLAYDHGDAASCTFTFGFDAVPAGESYYLVEVPGRGQLVYTESELRQGVDVTLGR